jgi:hypothetical protein
VAPELIKKDSLGKLVLNNFGANPFAGFSTMKNHTHVAVMRGWGQLLILLSSKNIKSHKVTFGVAMLSRLGSGHLGNLRQAKHRMLTKDITTVIGDAKPSRFHIRAFC